MWIIHFPGTERKEEEKRKCPNTATKETEDIDMSASGSGSDDDGSDDVSEAPDADDLSPSNDTMPTSPYP